MGPAVVISVVRRSRSHLKKKQRYESVQLQEYRKSQPDRFPRQMVSVAASFARFFSIFNDISRVCRRALPIGALILKDRASGRPRRT
ncbi:hypothetical protein X777_01681 [Ooceraea biroi]|uniref:Uncharacterized protein n=1 Tax=Ooceraea biroi TaxID=2015173 RepID=A0A026WM07_OOCBI|nr:hypothetical protein X777_01681 [Ooceraea biroi]